jgi:hypothetical protein
MGMKEPTGITAVKKFTAVIHGVSSFFAVNLNILSLVGMTILWVS